jgi:hypothetical protein
MGALKPVHLIGLLACLFIVTVVVAAVLLVVSLRNRPPRS